MLEHSGSINFNFSNLILVIQDFTKQHIIPSKMLLVSTKNYNELLVILSSNKGSFC